MQYNYNDCLSFVKHKLRVKLYPYQEKMLRAFCEGKEVRSARCVGRSYVAQAFGQYVASLHDKNDYSKQPDVVFPYTCAMEYGLITPKMIDHQREILSQAAFNREYLCE